MKYLLNLINEANRVLLWMPLMALHRPANVSLLYINEVARLFLLFLIS